MFAEKDVEFVSHEVNLMDGSQHDPEYVKLNPKHVVPTVVHEGRVILESSLTCGNRRIFDPKPHPDLCTNACV